MQSLDVYHVLSHFQKLNPEKLVAYNVDDITFYIADFDFFEQYSDKKYRTFKPLLHEKKYIDCVLDGASYIVAYNEKLVL